MCFLSLQRLFKVCACGVSVHASMRVYVACLSVLESLVSYKVTQAQFVCAVFGLFKNVSFLESQSFVATPQKMNV